MALKEQMREILEKSRETELAFIASLTADEKELKGSFEEWAAKDFIAHANYWEDFHIERIDRWQRGEALGPDPQFDEANRAIFDQFEGMDWQEIEAFAEETHEKTSTVLQALEEEALTGRSIGSEGMKFWQALLANFYTHKLLHYSDYYAKQNRNEEAGRLWGGWAEQVETLDPSPEWQGGVHYNAACSLALSGDREGALKELRKGLELRPSLKTWSRHDSDLAALHDDPRFRELFAPEYWWKALEAGPQVEALADQFLRALSMLRAAVATCPEGEWRSGETLYQRPAGLALHIAQTIDLYSTVKAGQGSGDPLSNISWEERDSERFPPPGEFLRYLDVAEQRLAHFLTTSDLMADESLFNWTGSTQLSRALYMLRHTQHHLADLAMELKRRGMRPPDWE
jgi:tetratricopeptide (TPR) repeat protein